MVTSRRPVAHSKKRHGHHQNRSKQFLQVYSPYLPMLVLVGFVLLFSFFLKPVPKASQVLGDSTGITAGTLLSATNSQRQALNKSSLSLNPQLSQAAQQKANDMVSRNYWSHTTPEHKEPWTFISDSGYPYTKAGENLAFGFNSGLAVVNGWMNSASHRQNLLDNSYTDVGFGTADSSNFVGNGPATVVVALYGSTVTQATANPAVLSSTNSRLGQQEPRSTSVNRLQITAVGISPQLIFLGYIVVFGIIGYLLMTHMKAIKRALKKTQRYAIKHPFIDSMLIVIVGLILFYGQHAGSIR